MIYKDFEEWQQAVKDTYPGVANKLKFKGRIEHGVDTISAEIGDKAYGVWDNDNDEGHILEAKMKLGAKSRLMASLEDPVSDGTSFDTLIDGDPSNNEPEVQEVTHDDGGIELPEEQHLLMDDLPV